ncbi:alpha/beta hydrolase [Streptomyces sp. NPDC056910]|uniref:alpha/beta hydrolase n=1 Tax=Streptomyces sp. NPDC056910 TaxID=3345964 RepID=UPI0036A97F7A
MTDLDTTPAPTSTAHTWRPPTGIAPRGTLVVLPGRGEHGPVYERFGRRIATDGYVVHALDTAPSTSADAVQASVAAALGPDPATPVVLVGSDTGALQALYAAAEADPAAPLQGLIVAGVASTDGASTADPGDWQAELEARTACPTHRQKLTDDERFSRGRLSEPVPDTLRTAARPGLPTLVLHGAADPVTPLARARTLVAGLDRATLGVLHEGRHDVLNDASHRTTAATVVVWLERLRADADLAPVLTLE